ncbi:MAG: Gfo/Idh/MocA family oxidoreductase [Actinomycetota bacterium]
MSGRLRVAVVGCGDISKQYGPTLAPYADRVDIRGATDLQRDRAESWTHEFGGRVYDSLDEILDDDTVDTVLNLTIHQAHKEVIERSLLAGKHVFSEKPLTIAPDDAQALVGLADAERLRLGCAPVGFCGEAQQTVWKLIREGSLGKIRLAYAEVNWGRPELWHPNPKPFYEVGPVFDVAVYPLTILTAIFGPARRVTAAGTTLLEDRMTLDGGSFTPGAPDLAVAFIEWEHGTVARVTANFYVSYLSRQPGAIEFHGDDGSLHLGSWFEFNARVQRASYGKRYEDAPLVREPYEGCEWSRGLVEMADAVAEDRPHRVTGSHAAHVVEIAAAIHASIDGTGPIELTSTFDVPEPMGWAR